MNPPSSPLSGKQPSLRRSLSTPLLCCGGSTAAEFCGGTTAGLAALCCCAPCSVVSLVVFAVYKAPRGICRRAIRRMRRRRRRGIARNDVSDNGDCEKKLGSSQFAVHPLESKDDGEFDKLALYLSEEEEEEDDEVVALEKEMWNRFNSGGFWRSVSQAETTSSARID
ncbi:hypothetical protein HA466_0003020 [Hirschfeldia incana]|nr:hypothetical protein HA466_0003020 [Hirschfeldia incana]